MVCGLISILILLLLPMGASASCGGSIGELAQYASWKEEQIKEFCQKNLDWRAGVDSKAAQRLNKKYVSACMDTYLKMQEEAQKYRASYNAKCQEIKSLVNCSQAGCTASSAENYKKAAQLEQQLIQELELAQKEVNKAIAANQRAMEKYLNDKREMTAALNKAVNDANQNPEIASSIKEKIYTASGISGGQLSNNGGEVAATDGGASTINEYNKNVNPLYEEQAKAKRGGEKFQEQVQSAKSDHLKKIAEYESLAGKTKMSSEKLGSISETENGAASSPTQGTGVNIPNVQLGSGEGASSPGISYRSESYSPPSNNKGTDTKKVGIAGITPTNLGGASTQESSGASSSMPATSNGTTTSTAGMPSGATSTETLSAKEGISAGSRAPASVAEEGAYSTAGSGTGASPEKQKEEMNKLFGTKNLDEGAVGIAGSELDSTVAALTDELGLQEGGALSEEELQALQLGGAEGITQAEAAAIGGENSMALFVRTKLAHERAFQRGLLLGKTKR